MSRLSPTWNVFPTATRASSSVQDDLLMDPPTYEEASLHPPALDGGALIIPPPPSYDASLPFPSTPPPTYGEAVTIQVDQYPVLTPLRAEGTLNPGTTIHPTSQIGVTRPINSRPGPVVTQPRSGPTMSVTHLKDVPGVVRCPHCHRVVNTNVTYQPGRDAWLLCILLTLMGLVCCICLIPLMVRSLQDAHHSCPECGRHIHIFTR